MSWRGHWPYFFRDDEDRHVTVNGNRYRSMITEYFWPRLDDMDLENMWFQQDGATSHTSNATIDLLETRCGERDISRNGPVAARFFFCGATLSLCFERILNVKLQQYRPIYA